MPHSANAAVSLPRIVDLDALDTIRETLLDRLATGGVTVDAGGVERIATNALFMLLSAGETARRGDLPFQISPSSAALDAAIARLGLAPAFAPYCPG